jgi:hypothetical protein
MTVELAIWLTISLIGMAALPFIGRRRAREERYHRMIRGNGVRAEILRNRSIRAALLSAGVVMAAMVALLSWWLDPSEIRRVLTIAMLIGVEVCMVAALILDEWFSDRIDKLERKRGR